MLNQQVKIGGIRLHPKLQEGFPSSGSESADVENVANQSSRKQILHIFQENTMKIGNAKTGTPQISELIYMRC